MDDATHKLLARPKSNRGLTLILVALSGCTLGGLLFAFVELHTLSQRFDRLEERIEQQRRLSDDRSRLVTKAGAQALLSPDPADPPPTAGGTPKDPAPEGTRPTGALRIAIIVVADPRPDARMSRARFAKALATIIESAGPFDAPVEVLGQHVPKRRLHPNLMSNYVDVLDQAKVPAAEAFVQRLDRLFRPGRYTTVCTYDQELRSSCPVPILSYEEFVESDADVILYIGARMTRQQDGALDAFRSLARAARQ